MRNRSCTGRCRRGCGGLASAQIQAWCAQTFLDVVVCTKRALNQAALLLALKVIFRTKPAFKQMTVLTLEIQYLHETYRTPVSAIQ